jgi:hypothetical protein
VRSRLAVAVVLGTLALLGLVKIPALVTTRVTCNVPGPGCEDRHETLLEAGGAAVLLLPAAFAVAGALVVRRRA